MQGLRYRSVFKGRVHGRGLDLYSGLGAEAEYRAHLGHEQDKRCKLFMAEAEYRAHLGHEQLTALVLTLREARYKDE